MLLTLLLTSCGNPASLAFTRGQFYERMGDVHNERENPLTRKGIWQYQQAIEQYSAAIKLQPKQAETYHRRGICYERIGEYENALHDLSEAIALSPNQSTLWRDRAVVYREMDLFDKSVDDYGQVLQLSPKDPYAKMAQSESYALGGHIPEALKVLDEAEKDGAPKAGLLCDRGQVYRAANNIKEMDAAYAAALAAAPHDCDTLARCGYSYMIIGQYQKAADDFGAMVALSQYRDRNCGYAIVYRALCLKLLHKDEEANKWLEDAIYEIQLPVASSSTAQDAQLAENWPYPAVQYLHNDISEKVFMQSAGTEKGRNTETKCYAGLVHYAAGDEKKAHELFEDVMANGRKGFIEYDIASHFARK